MDVGGTALEHEDDGRAQDDGRRSYHHGNLVEVLLAAAIALIEEKGVEGLSVREVAKKAGVSPAAPFRHFSSKTALLTAVAEQAMARLTEAVIAAEARCADDDPLVRLEAIGEGYLQWALDNPTHFEIVSSRRLIDIEASPLMREQNDAIRTRMAVLFAEAARRGRLSCDVDPDRLILMSRAFVYGLARMVVDGHFPEWHPKEAPQAAVRRALGAFIAGLPAIAGALANQTA